MTELAAQRLSAQLTNLRKQPASDAGKIERRIGRWLGRFTSAERLIDVALERDSQKRVRGLKIKERADQRREPAWLRELTF